MGVSKPVFTCIGTKAVDNVKDASIEDLTYHSL